DYYCCSFTTSNNWVL
nr:immunoglobulin light chain junction region [Macaca mulatta]